MMNDWIQDEANKAGVLLLDVKPLDANELEVEARFKAEGARGPMYGLIRVGTNYSERDVRLEAGSMAAQVRATADLDPDVPVFNIGALVEVRQMGQPHAGRVTMTDLGDWKYSLDGEGRYDLPPRVAMFNRQKRQMDIYERPAQ